MYYQNAGLIVENLFDEYMNEFKDVQNEFNEFMKMINTLREIYNDINKLYFSKLSAKNMYLRSCPPEKFTKFVCINPFKPNSYLHGIDNYNSQIRPCNHFFMDICFDAQTEIELRKGSSKKHVEKGKYTISYINGKDLSNESLVMEVITFIATKLKKKIVTYQVIPLNNEEGIAEYVDYINEPFISVKNLKLFLSNDIIIENNFCESLAFWLLFSYCFDIGDSKISKFRINKYGEVFRVDINEILGANDQKIGVGFEIPKIIAQLLNNNAKLQKKIFICITNNFYNLKTVFPELLKFFRKLQIDQRYDINPDYAMKFISDMLFLKYSDKEALTIIKKLFNTELNRRRTNNGFSFINVKNYLLSLLCYAN
ncbi:Phosphatidylinositol 3-kinase catalytic subunit type 3 [Conglomerata obtusa]